MLDQRLIRENPSYVEERLSTRGKDIDLSQIHSLTLHSKEIDTKLCQLQTESKKLSKLFGEKIRNSEKKNDEELNDLKNKGNEFKFKISKYEEEKRKLDKQIKLGNISFNV